jgi:outer membrane protein TolC
MRKFLLLSIVWVILFGSVRAALSMNITELLTAARNQPDIQQSELAVAEADLKVQEAYAALYPKIDAFGRYEDYNSPTNLRPLPPTEVNVARGDSIPFSKEIIRYGITAQMPLFVKTIFTLADQLKLVKNEASLARQVDVVKKEASVVSLNSVLTYLDHLEQALQARQASLTQTRLMVARKVANGRAAEAEVLKIDKAVNDMAQQQNDVSLKILDVKRDIRKLTGVILDQFVSMRQVHEISSGPFITERLLQTGVEAAKKEMQRNRERFYPSLFLEGTLSQNEGTAYNTDESIDRTYNSIAVVLKVPLFEKDLLVSKDIANVKLKRAEKTLAQARIDLSALAENIEARLPVLEQSIALTKQTAENATQLLKIAQVAYTNERMTTEEYLRYEAEVLQAEAGLAEMINARWQLVAQKALLYGTDLTGVVQ